MSESTTTGWSPLQSTSANGCLVTVRHPNSRRKRPELATLPTLDYHLNRLRTPLFSFNVMIDIEEGFTGTIVCSEKELGMSGFQ